MGHTIDYIDLSQSYLAEHNHIKFKKNNMLIDVCHLSGVYLCRTASCTCFKEGHDGLDGFLIFLAFLYMSVWVTPIDQTQAQVGMCYGTE